MVPDRAVFIVRRHEGDWAVELNGEVFGRSREQAVAKAAANRRIREMQDAGRACQLRVEGETGFYLAP